MSSIDLAVHDQFRTTGRPTGTQPKAGLLPRPKPRRYRFSVEDDRIQALYLSAVELDQSGVACHDHDQYLGRFRNQLGDRVSLLA